MLPAARFCTSLPPRVSFKSEKKFFLCRFHVVIFNAEQFKIYARLHCRENGLEIKFANAI